MVNVTRMRYVTLVMGVGWMPRTTMLHVRVDEETKGRATDALAAMGLSVSEAVRVFLRRIAADEAFPFELKVPNASTRGAMEEARVIAQSSPGRFAQPDELFNDLAVKGE